MFSAIKIMAAKQMNCCDDNEFEGLALLAVKKTRVFFSTENWKNYNNLSEI
jgi:hypothetical protein